MHLRKMRMDDYGISHDEAEKLKELCRKPDLTIRYALRDAAYQANPDIAEDLIFSLANGVSYERMEVVKDMWINMVDFYAYRRKTLALFKERVEH